MIFHDKYNKPEIFMEQKTLFIFQALNSINKTVLFLVSEIMFEFLKLRLNEMGIINEYHDLLNYDQFYHIIQYDCFSDYLNLMKMIMKFYPCPDPTKNHPNLHDYKSFKNTLNSSDFLELKDPELEEKK